MCVSTCRDQKGVSNPQELELQVVVSYFCGCWELEEQVLSTAEPFLQPLVSIDHDFSKILFFLSVL